MGSTCAQQRTQQISLPSKEGKISNEEQKQQNNQPEIKAVIIQKYKTHYKQKFGPLIQKVEDQVFVDGQNQSIQSEEDLQQNTQIVPLVPQIQQKKKVYPKYRNKEKINFSEYYQKYIQQKIVNSSVDSSLEGSQKNKSPKSILKNKSPIKSRRQSQSSFYSSNSKSPVKKRVSFSQKAQYKFIKK